MSIEEKKQILLAAVSELASQLGLGQYVPLIQFYLNRANENEVNKLYDVISSICKAFKTQKK